MNTPRTGRGSSLGTRQRRTHSASPVCWLASMASMSTSRAPLNVAGLRRLSLARHDHLRIDVLSGADVKPNDLLRGSYRGALPLTATVKQAGRQGDLIGTFWANVYAITARFSDSLQRLGITGWGVLPISVAESSPSISGLSLLTVTGRSGPIIGAGGVDRPGVDSIGQYLDPSEGMVPISSCQ